MLDISSNCKLDTASLPVNLNSFTFLETTPTEVYKVLYTLKVNKAAGLDIIPAGLLKLASISYLAILVKYILAKKQKKKILRSWNLKKSDISFQPEF